MARAIFVKKARKNIPGTSIKTGDSYYWWKFRFGVPRVPRNPVVVRDDGCEDRNTRRTEVDQ